jgi:hypothetical protein
MRETLASGDLKSPRDRVLAEEILDLLTDVAQGRAGNDHLLAIDSLVDEWIESGEAAAREMGVR